jgi:hypothetical protein
MLVCNVSQPRRRAAISADIAEAAAAADSLRTAVFDAIVAEAAAAADVINAGLEFSVSVAEASTAADTTDGSVVSAPAFSSWNPADKATVTLTNSNLTATCTSSAPSGVRSVASKTSGKYYFEITTGATWAGSGSSLGLATASFAFGAGNQSGFAGVVRAIGSNGGIYIDGTHSGVSLGVITSSQLICFAVDLSAGLFWARSGAAGNWNNNASNNPATGVGGLSLGAMSGSALFVAFGSQSNNDVCTANLGASAFSGAVPSGFTAGWTP